MANANVSQSAIETLTLPNPFSQLFQSAVDVLVLGNPFCNLSQSALEMIVLPAVSSATIVLRGFKRVPGCRPGDFSAAPGLPPVKRAV
jgi:hypothetical protein